MLRSIRKLTGRAVQAADGDAGTVAAFYFDDRRWMVRYVAVDPGDMAPGKKEVLLSPVSLISASMASGAFGVRLTRRQVGDSPEIDISKPVDRQFEARVAAQYGRSRDTGDARPAGEGGAAPPEEPGGTAVMERDFSRGLVSARDMIGCAVDSAEGRAGTVDDIVVDDGSWSIRHFIVDIDPVSPGRKVAVPPQSVVAADEGARVLRLDLTNDDLRGSSPVTR